MILYGLNDAGLRAACFKSYNDFVAEYCTYNPDRLVGMGLITLEDISAGVAELKRCADKGLRGAMIWASPPDDSPYGHADYDPFWAAAQDLQMPLSLHILTGRGGTGFDLNRVLTSYMSLPAEIQRTLATMIFGGVFERFPKLQIVSAENDVSWIPHFMYRLDHAYDRFRHFEGVNLSMLPSEYLKRNVVATFQFEKATADFTRQLFGAESIMWSSDYPHTDSTWPKSQEFITDAFKGMPEGDIQKIVSDNAARIYRIQVN
jgi:predicted TIM-barrel fold metal-dependent hydrolase